MAITLSLSDLLSAETKQAIYTAGLSVAEGVGLPVTSWQPGDPTRSLYWFVAEILNSLETVVVNYVGSGFLDWAAEDEARYTWLVHLAYQVYGYEADEADYASGTVRLTNGGGGLYEIAAGDITVKNSTTDATYHNTSGGTLASGPATTLDLTFVADEAGTDSNAGIGDIDTMVTSLLEVTCANTTAFVGLDNETASSIVSNARAKLGSLSPNGPADAYDYVAKNDALTGTTGINRTRSYDDSVTGDVTLYLAGSSGAVSAGDVTAVEDAIALWATPLCVTPTVASASNKTIDVTYELWLYDSSGYTEAEAAAEIVTALGELMAARAIGGDIKAAVGSGKLYVATIERAIKGVFRQSDLVDLVVTLPASDVAIADSEVPVIGTITKTAIHFEVAP